VADLTNKTELKSTHVVPPISLALNIFRFSRVVVGIDRSWFSGFFISIAIEYFFLPFRSINRSIDGETD
jgi:hypothetical protein